MRAMRRRQLLGIGSVAFLLICIASLVRRLGTNTDLLDGTLDTPRAHAAADSSKQPSKGNHQKDGSSPSLSSGSNFKYKTAPVGVHPIQLLVAEAENELGATKARQSKTLQQAVTEYRRRYGIPPPPNFNKWFEFAQAKGVQLVDEFDMIYESITPFWGLKPSTIRERAAEALGFNNALLGIQIRNGRITHIDGGADWQREATAGMMGKFLKWLPDMDLCFNLHDESRVVVPHDDMARLVQKAKEVNMPAANIPSPKNAFTEKPKGLNDGIRFEESKLTRFNVFAHQPTWTHSRMSCPPNSPSRALEEDERNDDISRYGLSELGFVYNVSAMSDICYSPSLSSTFGFLIVLTRTTSSMISSRFSLSPRSLHTRTSSTHRRGTGTRRSITMSRRIWNGIRRRTGSTGAGRQRVDLVGTGAGDANTGSGSCRRSTPSIAPR